MSEPRDLADLTGEPDRRYVSPVLANTSQGRQRAWLICVLVLALGLPALVVTLGYNRPAEPAEAMAAPASTETTRLDTTSESLVKVRDTRKPATTTTIVEDTTTSTAAPTTSSTYATTSTSAFVTSTSTTAPAYQAVQSQAPPPTTAAPTTTAAPYVAPPPPPPAQGEAAFLACVRQRESGGNYGAVSPDGLYRGAYQFHQATWDNTARMAGRPDLVGVPANLAGPGDQDLLAITLYRAAGSAPWGGYCG